MEVRLPKNICQVGITEYSKKILVEDYVVSFLKELLKDNWDSARVIMFFGDGFWQEKVEYFLIKGMAVMDKTENSLTLEKEEESYFRRQNKKYFADMKGIGWYILENHQNSPARGDMMEIEEILRSMKEQDFSGIRGYYIYYEKNEAMEEYLISWHEEKERRRVVARTAIPASSQTQTGKKKMGNRKKIRGQTGGHGPVRKSNARRQPAKKRQQVQQGIIVQVLNGISLIILIICSIIALTTLNQYDKLKQLETTVTYLEETIEAQKNLPDY